MGGACPPQPPKNYPGVAAYARQASSAVTHAVTPVENYDAASTGETVRAVTYAENALENFYAASSERDDETPPANWREIMERGDLPPGLPPGYPKRQAPWKEPVHAKPIPPPQMSSVSPSMAGFLNVSPPPPATSPGSQQAVPSIARRVMPPPPPVVPANRNAEIPSVVPTRAPSTKTTGPDRLSGGVRRNWEKQLRYATSQGPETRKNCLKKYGSWFPYSREEYGEAI